MVASKAGTVALTVGFGGSVQALAFSPDNTRVAAGGGDSLVRVRVIGTGPLLDIPSEGFVSSLAYSPDGTMLAVADLDQIFVRGTDTGAVRWQGPIESGSSVNTVAFTSDGRSLVAATDRFVATFDAVTGKEAMRKEIERQQISGLDVSRDGTRIAVAIDERHGGDHRNEGSARVLDFATGTEVSRLTPDNAVFDVAFSPDGKGVLCGSADGTTRMFEAAPGGKELWNQPHESSHLAFDPTGKNLVVGGSDAEIRVLDAKRGLERTRRAHDGAVTAVAFAPNGLWAASAGIDGMVIVLLATKEAENANRYVLTNTDEVHTMRFSADSRWLGLGTSGGVVVVDNGPVTP
jgi:WD40 repeat protein